MTLHRSSSIKFIAATFVLLLIGQTAGLIMYLVTAREALTDSLQTRMTRQATILTGVGAEALRSYDYSLFDRSLNEVSRDPEITSIHLTDENGTVVREKISRLDEAESSLNPLHYAETFETKLPIIDSGRTVGAISIHYVPQSVNEMISRSMAMSALYQGILLLAVGLLLMFLFNRYIKNPVTAITKSVEKIKTGDLSVSVPEVGKDEIGSIAQGLAFLQEKLAITVGQINATAINLAMAIRQVESTYRRAVESMTKQSATLKDIVKAVQDASGSQNEISESTQKLQTFFSENVATLAEMKTASEEIATYTKRLFLTAENTYAVALEMSQTARIVKQSIIDVSAGLDDTSAAVEEIEASIKEVAEHARESSQLAEQVKEVTSAVGMMSVVNATEGMETIEQQVHRSTEIVQQLGTRSADIEKVLSVIRDVTEQTNLLSLNAAILAAQAGEYGKSFSVVADEIRGLSERTATSTREIGGIVKTIQREIKDAVQSITITKEKVGDGNMLVIKVGEALRDILNASVQSSDMTKAIERATDEQSLGLRQITGSIEDIRRTMNGIVKSTNEQEQALGHLLEGIGDVKEVADVSKRGTTEQSDGIRNMSRYLDMANDRINQISAQAKAQKHHNIEVVQAMNQIDNIGMATLRDVQQVTDSLNALTREMEALKQTIEVFKTE